MVTTKDVQKLRAKTGYGVMDCHKALLEANGDFEKAEQILKAKGAQKFLAKQERETKNGVIECYSHGGKVGVMIEVLCETDFVARTPEFTQLAHNLALQVASMAPQSPKELYEQVFIKDESRTVEDLIKEEIAKFGENIKVSRFQRWEL